MNTSVRAPAGRWKLKDDYAREVQGLVASHFAHLKAAEAVFLELPQGAGGAWLAALRRAVPVSDATGSREDEFAAAIAFTHSGLRQMNLLPDILDTFSTPFREGMHQTDRQRRLGDSPDPKVGTVIPTGALWSGNTPGTYASAPGRAAHTSVTVHGVLIIYAADDPALETALAPVLALLTTEGVGISRRRRLSLREDAAGISREHFGFADGISQPIPTGDAIIPPTDPSAAEQARWHGVKAGEILLGHLNIHNELAPGPLIAVDRDPAAASLSAVGAPEGFRSLGFNGSYLVIRELRQHVAAFWKSMEDAARTLNRSGVDAPWLAERLVGRRLDGSSLIFDDGSGGTPANNFGYAQSDVHGFKCPLGAHVRRANPRDSFPSRDQLKPDLSASQQLLDAANAHRILRRGRKYGADIANPRQDDGQDRGLLFMCLNSDLVRHFEFVQEHWLLNESFATLFDETDPLLGPPGKTTIPARPLRLRPAVETYVQLVGGEYFFLPSLSALNYLETLR